jgi:alkaline phosphatase D
MSISRREMLKASLSLTAGMLLPMPLLANVGNQSTERRKTLSIVQGATDESRAQFSIVHPANLEIQARVFFLDGREVSPARVDRLRSPGQGAATAVTHFYFSDLLLGQDMKLSVFNAGWEMIDQRLFRTLDPNNPALKFAICSCMDESRHDAGIWNDLAAQSPDLIFFVGDCTYVDWGHEIPEETMPARLWRRFSEARAKLEIYHQPRLIPILAVWDDHDFGSNDTNSTDFPYVAESQKNFRAFFPANPEYCRFVESGPGISISFSFRGQQVILLDDRSYRLPSGSTERHAHWGREQEEWALRKVSAQPVTWLMNGSQFFPKIAWKESVSQNHPEQLAGLLGELVKQNGKVIFASGDVHYSEISRIEPEKLGYETFEFTSSAIHSPNFPGSPGIVHNPRRIASTAARNYVLVEGQESGGKLAYRVSCRSAGNVTRFQKEFSIS